VIRPLAVVAALAFLLVFIAPAYAVSDPSEMLANPTLERRAEAIGNQLRCVVCQNESIEQSDADLAKDLRHIIRQQVVAGQSDQQITAWMVSRYGDFIRLRPPFELMTLMLWGAPVIALGVGATAVWLARRRQPPPPAPLSRSEQQRVADLLE
jgi:cytochrome c-type biogenesis protein CcmH